MLNLTTESQNKNILIVLSDYYLLKLLLPLTMDKLNLKGQKLGRVFDSRLGRAWICHAIAYITERHDLKLKTRPKQLLGSLQLTIALITLIY
jgi:hypothetical protein